MGSFLAIFSMSEKKIYLSMDDEDIINWETKKLIKAILVMLEGGTNYLELPEKNRSFIREGILNNINSFSRLVKKLIEYKVHG